MAGVLLTGILLGRWWSAAPAPAVQPALSGWSSAKAVEAGSTRQSGDGNAQAPDFDADLARLRDRPRAIDLSPEGVPLLSDWQDSVEAILVADTNADAKAEQMLELFPRLPEDGQREVAQHLSHFLSDTNYPALGQYLTNAATPEPVLDVLLAGLLNRPNAVRLPWLLQVAQDGQNPRSEQAHDLLQVFLEKDFGNDWRNWQSGINDWLKDNPDKLASQ